MATREKQRAVEAEVAGGAVRVGRLPTEGQEGEEEVGVEESLNLGRGKQEAATMATMTKRRIQRAMTKRKQLLSRGGGADRERMCNLGATAFLCLTAIIV